MRLTTLAACLRALRPVLPFFPRSLFFFSPLPGPLLLYQLLSAQLQEREAISMCHSFHALYLSLLPPLTRSASALS